MHDSGAFTILFRILSLTHLLAANLKRLRPISRHSLLIDFFFFFAARDIPYSGERKEELLSNNNVAYHAWFECVEYYRVRVDNFNESSSNRHSHSIGFISVRYTLYERKKLGIFIGQSFCRSHTRDSSVQWNTIAHTGLVCINNVTPTSLENGQYYCDVVHYALMHIAPDRVQQFLKRRRESSKGISFVR